MMNNEKIKKNRKSLRIGSYSIGLSAVVLAVVILVNLFVGQLPETLTKPDTSSNGMLSIGEDSEKIVDGVDEDVTLYLIAESGSEDPTIETYLNRYAAMNSKITVSTVDPVTHPSFTAEYTSDTVNQNSVIAVSDKRSKIVDYNDFYQYEVTGAEGTYYPKDEFEYYQQYYANYGQTLTGTMYFFGENAITGALDYISSDELPVMYTLTGHGESELTATYQSLIADENVDLKSLSLLTGDEISVPDDAEAVLIFSPTSDMSAEEEKALESYVAAGGDIILLTGFDSYSSEKMPNFAALGSFMGLEAVEDGTAENFIVEGDTDHCYPNYPYYLLPNVSPDGINSLMSSTDVYVFMVLCHGIQLTGTNDSVEAVSLMTTSDSAYLYSDESKKGATYNLAYQSTLKDSDGNAEGTLIWFGTPNLLADDFAGYGNPAVFAAAMQQTCDKKASVSIIGKQVSSGSLAITATDSMLWNVVMWGVIPLAALVTGFVVWIRRRRK